MPMNALRIIQITDTHLVDHAEEDFYGLNTCRSFQSTLHHALQQHPDADGLLLTGDISQTGSTQSYEVFNSVIRDCPLPVYAVPGNHDNPIHLRSVIPNAPVDQIRLIDLGETTFILLNSFVAEGKNHGELPENMLFQLKQQLDISSNSHNVVVIHHPPILTQSRWLDELGLLNRQSLMNCLHQYQKPITVICGHVHQEINRHVDNVHIVATPSTGYQFIPNSDDMRRTDTPDPAYRYLELTAQGISRTNVHYINQGQQRLAS